MSSQRLRSRLDLNESNLMELEKSVIATSDDNAGGLTQLRQFVNNGLNNLRDELINVISQPLVTPPTYVEQPKFDISSLELKLDQLTATINMLIDGQSSCNTVLGHLESRLDSPQSIPTPEALANNVAAIVSDSLSSINRGLQDLRDEVDHRLSLSSRAYVANDSITTRLLSIPEEVAVLAAPIGDRLFNIGDQFEIDPAPTNDSIDSDCAFITAVVNNMAVLLSDFHLGVDELLYTVSGSEQLTLIRNQKVKIVTSTQPLSKKKSRSKKKTATNGQKHTSRSGTWHVTPLTTASHASAPKKRTKGTKRGRGVTINHQQDVSDSINTVNGLEVNSDVVRSCDVREQKWKWFHLSSIVPLTVDHLRRWVSDRLGGCEIKCFSLTTPLNPYSKTFKLGVPKALSNRLFSKTFWPVGTIVREFGIRKNFHMHRYINQLT